VKDIVNKTPLGALCLEQLRELFDDQRSRGPPRRRARRQGKGTKRGRRGSISGDDEESEDEGAIRAAAKGDRVARRAPPAGAQGPMAAAPNGRTRMPAAAAPNGCTRMPVAPSNVLAVAAPNAAAVSALPSLDELAKLADLTTDVMGLFREAKEENLIPTPIFDKSVADLITPGMYSVSQLEDLKTLTIKRLGTMRKFQALGHAAMNFAPQVWNSK